MMNDKLLTVKEVAEIANVSTQYIYKLMKDKLQTYVVEVDNQRQLKNTVLSKYFKIELQTVSNNVDNQLPTDDNDFATVANQKDVEFTTYLKEEIRNKNKQLDLKDEIIKEKESLIKEKDDYIKELTSTITEMTERVATLFENSQQLQQNQQLLEAKTIADTAIENGDEEKEPPKGFFKKIFGKK